MFACFYLIYLEKHKALDKSTGDVRYMLHVSSCCVRGELGLRYVQTRGRLHVKIPIIFARY